MGANTLQDLKARFEQAQQDFVELARRLAGDEQVDEGEAARILLSCGRTPDDLEAAVDRQRRIRELRGIVDRRPEAERAMTKHNQEGVALFESLKAERRELEEKIAGLEAEHQHAGYLLRVELMKIDAAGQELRSLATPAEKPQGETVAPTGWGVEHVPLGTNY